MGMLYDVAFIVDIKIYQLTAQHRTDEKIIYKIGKNNADKNKNAKDIGIQ